MRLRNEAILAARTAASITRNHSTPNLDKSDSVGKHTYNMIAMCYQLFPDCSSDLIKRIVYHDIPEIIMGDIPGFAKRQYPSLGEAAVQVENSVNGGLGIGIELNEQDEARFEFLDRAEFALWCAEQKSMGLNTWRFKKAMEGTFDYLEDIDSPDLIAARDDVISLATYIMYSVGEV